MKPKDFQKYRLPLASELLRMNYDLNYKSLLDAVPPEDRPTVEEAQRLRDEFAKSFPALEEKLKELRAQALAERVIWEPGLGPRGRGRGR